MYTCNIYICSHNTNKIIFNTNNSLSNEFSRITLFPYYRFQEIFLRKCAGIIRKYIFQLCRKLYVCATYKSYSEHFKLVQNCLVLYTFLLAHGFIVSTFSKQKLYISKTRIIKRMHMFSQKLLLNS